MDARTASVLVCVTDQPECHRLIRAGAMLAKQYRLPLYVVSVMPPRLVSVKTAEALQALYNVSSKLGAEMTVYFNDEAALTVAVHARKVEAGHLVIGAPGPGGNTFIEVVRDLLPEAELSMVTPSDGADGGELQICRFPAAKPVRVAEA